MVEAHSSSLVTPFQSMKLQVDILKLPDELLEYIFSFLCEHCLNHEKTGTDRMQIGLWRICLVCSRFRRIAQPTLFHSYNTKRAGKGKNLLLFLRTLLDRPDLAASVKDIGLYKSKAEFEPIVGMYEEIINQASLRLSLDREDRPDIWSPTIGSYGVREFIEELVLAHVPSIRSLEIEQGSPSNTDNGKNLFSIMNSTAFPLLRKLSLLKLGSLVSALSGDWYSLGDAAHIFAKTPNLQTIIGTNVNRFLRPQSQGFKERHACAHAFQNITTLVFEESCLIPLPQLENMLRLFKNLRTLQWRNPAPSGAPGEIYKALEPVCATLKELRLRLRFVSIVGAESSDPVAPVAETTGLYNFHALDLLCLDQASFRPWRMKSVPENLSPSAVVHEDSEPEDFGDGGDALVEILPHNLQTLCIADVYQESISTDLSHLLSRVRGGDFFRLKKIYVTAEYYPAREEERGEIVSDYESVGVEVRFGKVDEREFLKSRVRE